MPAELPGGNATDAVPPGVAGSRIAALDSRDADELRLILRDMCLDSCCYELAVAIHEGTGLPLVGLWSDTASGDDRIPGTWRHAAVRHGDGYFDARGHVSGDEFGVPFGESGPWDIRDITRADLERVRPLRKAGVTLPTLGRMAQAAWPELPWRDDTWHRRAEAFLADIEEASRKHGIWIRSPYPAARPMLALGEGDEAGYRAETVAHGYGIVFDRKLGPAR